MIELIGGLMLLVGFGTRWAALALAVFTAVAAFFFHNYWALPADQQMMQQLMFGKNMAIAGGLLAFFAFGPGRFSFEGPPPRLTGSSCRWRYSKGSHARDRGHLPLRLRPHPAAGDSRGRRRARPG